MAKYRVFVKRTETYTATINVCADSAKEASEKAEEEMKYLFPNDWDETDTTNEVLYAEVKNED